MIAQSLIFRRLTAADFKNISGQGGVTGGGGQGYIDLSIRDADDGINEKNLKKFFGKYTEKVAQGLSWTFEINSLSLGHISQSIKIYQRRSTSFCIASQKVGTRESNRVAAWDSQKTGFPAKKYDELNNPLYIYIIKDTDGKYWAGWFYRNDFDSTWFMSKELLKIFTVTTGNGYIELDNVNFDTDNFKWPFFGERKKENVKKMKKEEFEQFPKNWIFFGAPGTSKSYTLNENSKAFTAQELVKQNDVSELKNKIALAEKKAKKLNALNALGFEFSSILKTKSRPEIVKEFGVKSPDELYVGAKAKEYADKINIEFSDEDVFKVIKDEVAKAQANTKEILSSLNAVGYVFSDYLLDMTQGELKKEFNLVSDAQIWFFYKGIQAKQLQQEREDIQYVERVTFHPNYSYAQFVGCYKPVQQDGGDGITYKYVPGPFMRVLKNALKYPEKYFLLIVEEINRANVAAVFGDVFQLLDRDKNGESVFGVAASEDVKHYLEEQNVSQSKELKIPHNMLIWASMNSADQGVYPMDTAFKRRWIFKYIDINNQDLKIKDHLIPIPHKEGETISYTRENWSDLRKKINKTLIQLGTNEDKLLGPFFLSTKILDSVKIANDKTDEIFVDIFKSKVLMYLFEDVMKLNPMDLFDIQKKQFSLVCEKFDSAGTNVFKLKD